MIRQPHVALIVETSSAYGRSILRGIARYVRLNSSWSIYLEQRALTTRPPSWLEHWQGDGIISRATDRRLAALLKQSGIPVVDLTDRHGNSGFPRIRSDDEVIGRLAAAHLLERGFRQLAFCGFERERWSKRRCDAFAAAVSDAGLPCATFQSPWHGPEKHAWEDEQRSLTSWILQLPKPLGIMACNDVRGQQVLDACGRTGLAVPDEVAVIGVDNDPLLCSLSSPPLSSVITNAERVGFDAAELLNQLMTHRATGSSERLVLPLGVETRQSTDVTAIDDPDIAMAVKIIRESACHGVKVEDVLERVPLSRSILERRMRHYLGCTPSALIRQTQIKRVQQLLVESDFSLDRIGKLAGFKHAEHLCVAFKRSVGETPGEYRKRARI